MSSIVAQKLTPMNDKKWKIVVAGSSIEVREQVDRLLKTIRCQRLHFFCRKHGSNPCRAAIGWSAYATICGYIDSHRLAKERVLPVSILSGDQKVVNIHLKTGLEMMSSLYVGWTALQWATATDHRNVVRILLTREKNSETSMKRIEEALFLAAAKGHCAILQLLLAYKPDLEAKNENTEIPLLLAVNNNHNNMAVLLLKQGANVNAVAQNRGTAIYMGKCEPVLHRAIRSAAMTVTLLSYGADIDAKDAYRQTALYCAVVVGTEHTVDQLLANGADIMIETLMGETPWYRAHLKARKISLSS